MSVVVTPINYNEGIKSRVTYSVIVPKLVADDIQAFILSEFDKAGLGHNVVTQDALALIARSSEGIIRRARNIAVSSLLETIRDQVKTIDIRQVNNVLLQPHWRANQDIFVSLPQPSARKG